MTTHKVFLAKQKQLYLIISAVLLAALMAVLVHPAIIVILAVLAGGMVLFVKAPFQTLLILIIFRAGIDSLGRQYRLFSGSSYSLNILGLFNIGLVVLAVLYFLLLKRKIPRYPFIFLGGLFLYILLVSFIPSEDKMMSLRGWMLVGSFFAIYTLLVSQLKDKQAVELLRWALVISVIIPILFALYQFMTGTGNTIISPGLNRVMGTFFHPSALAMYLVILWPLIVLQMIHGRTIWHKLFYFGLVAITTFVIGITYTRVAWVALLLSGVMVLLLFRKFKLLIITAVLAIPAAFYFSQPILSRFQEAFYFENGRLVLAQSGSVAWRLGQWRTALQLLSDHPVVGVGWWTFPLHNVWGGVTHNDYLRIAAESGLLGLFSYLALMFFIVYWLFKHYRRFPYSSHTAQIIGAVLICMISYLVLGITDNPLGQPEVSWYLWATIALGVGAVQVFSKKEPDTNKVKA